MATTKAQAKTALNDANIGIKAFETIPASDITGDAELAKRWNRAVEATREATKLRADILAYIG